MVQLATRVGLSVKQQVVMVLAVLLLCMAAPGANAQVGGARQSRTRGAKAAYGQPTERYTTKKKSKKAKKKKSKKPKKTSTPMYRKRDPWAG